MINFLSLLVWISLIAVDAASIFAQPADSPWPMFGGNAQRTGQSIYGESQNSNWIFQTNGTLQSSPAIGIDGTIYIGSRDKNLYAINPDGSLKWKFPTHYIYDSSPSIGIDGTVYIGSLDGLYAVNPDGSLKWKISIGRADHYHPTIGIDGTIYIYSESGQLHAVNPDGSLKWEIQTGQIRTPVISNDGTIYFSTSESLHAVNTDGSIKWQFQADLYSYYSSPAIGFDGIAYVNATERATAGRRDASKKLYAVNPDGSLKWKISIDGHTQSSTAIKIPFADATLAETPLIGIDGTIYVGGSESFYAINPDGSIKWEIPIGVATRPVISTDGTIYYFGTDGHTIPYGLGYGLYAVNPDGSIKWSRDFDNLASLEVWHQSYGQVWINIFHTSRTPTLGVDGTIYIGINKNLWAIKDVEPPTLFHLLLPTSGAHLLSQTFSWTESADAILGLSHYQLVVDGSIHIDSLTNTTITLDQSNELSIGSHLWYVNAVDKGGNIRQSGRANSVVSTIVYVETRQLNIESEPDIAPPAAFTLMLPINSGAMFGPTITFSWTSSSDEGWGLSHYQLVIGDSMLVDNITTTSVTLDSTNYPISGFQVWKVNAIDYAGNVRTVESQDITPPTAFTLRSPHNGSKHGSTISFSWTSSSDADWGLSHYQLVIDEDVHIDNITTTSVTLDSTNYLTSGFHVWKVNAVDYAGNVRTSDDIWSVQVDSAPPAVFSLLTPADDIWTNNTSPSLTWQASTDAGSGLMKYQLYINDILKVDNIPLSARLCCMNQLWVGFFLWSSLFRCPLPPCRLLAFLYASSD